MAKAKTEATTCTQHADAKLLKLGQKAESLFAQLSAAFRTPAYEEEVDRLYALLKPIAVAIARTRASTLEGVKVKVRYAAWCVGDDPRNDINPIEEAETTDVSMALSIARDLITMEGLAPGGPGWSRTPTPRRSAA